MLPRLFQPPRPKDFENRAEFDYDDDFNLKTLLKDTYKSFHQSYVDLDTTSWERCAWHVGIACRRFPVSKWLDRDDLGHWAVWIVKLGSNESQSSSV